MRYKNAGNNLTSELCDEVEQSPNDPKTYRVIRLPNGLTTLLICDQKSSARDSAKNEAVDRSLSVTSNTSNLTADTSDCHNVVDIRDHAVASCDPVIVGDNRIGSVTAREPASDSTRASHRRSLCRPAVDAEMCDEWDISGCEDDDGVTGEEDGGVSHKKKTALTSHAQTEKQSAAALCIGVGSFSDPPQVPGLAHFLEHMVFLGSEKYPTENGFDVFLKQHGGSSNAYTDCERTVFYFDVQQKYFHDALDHFAQFFIKSLLRRDCADRELNAVDSEFEMSLTSDKYRKEQLLASMAIPGQPMGKFMWGNSESLRRRPYQLNVDVLDELQTFYQQHYLATDMTLAVQSRDSLDTLADWVTKIFSAVPGGKTFMSTDMHHMPATVTDVPHQSATDSPASVTSPTITTVPLSYNINGSSDYQTVFDMKTFHKLYKVRPVKDCHSVELTWSLPCLHQHYKTKPLHYIGWLTGHEGQGSILAYLKRKLWATALHSGNNETGFEHNSTCALFSIGIELTDEGFTHLYEVLTAVFEYLALLQHTGPNERVFNEIKTIEDNDFRWQQQEDPIELVSEVSENMHLYPTTHYLTGDTLLWTYDPDIIRMCQDSLLPSLCNITVMSRNYTEDQCTEREIWFQSAYAVEDIPAEWIEHWENVQPSTYFHLPAKNAYIATDFTLLTPATEWANKPHPSIVRQSERSQLWYKADCKFATPKAYVNFLLLTPNVSKTPTSWVLFDLFVKVLDQNLSEVAYEADVAQLGYSVRAYENGVIIAVGGFSDKLQSLFRTVIDYIAQFEVSRELFNSMKTQLSKLYHNNYIKPHKLAKEVRLSLLEQNYWTAVDKQQCLPRVTYEMLVAYVKELTSIAYVQGLVQGNVSVEDACKMESYLLEKLACVSLPRSMFPQNRVVELVSNDRYCRVYNMNTKDNNSVISNYYQSGPGGIRHYVLNELLATQMEEPCFDILRTRHQLGYSVECVNRTTQGVLGLSIVVVSQAAKFNMADLDCYIEDFLVEFRQSKVAAMTEDEFKLAVASLCALKRCEDNSLGEEVERNWQELLQQTSVFDRLTREIAELEKLTLSDYIAWFDSFLLQSSGNVRKLSVQVVGRSKTIEDNLKPPGADVANNSVVLDESDLATDSESGESSESDSEASNDGDMNTLTPGGEHAKGLSHHAAPSPCLDMVILEMDILHKAISDIRAFQDSLKLFPVTKLL